MGAKASKAKSTHDAFSIMQPKYITLMDEILALQAAAEKRERKLDTFMLTNDAELLALQKRLGRMSRDG